MRSFRIEIGLWDLRSRSWVYEVVRVAVKVSTKSLKIWVKTRGSCNL